MKASADALEALHARLANAMKDMLEDSKASGEILSASHLKEIREFLKDNDISGTGAPGTPLAGLLDEDLPFPADNPSH